jgi:hypothetical protein
MTIVLSLVLVFVGICIVISGSLFLGFMVARPRAWEKFTESENQFWVKRGFPVQWAGACKRFEQGRTMKLAIVLCVVLAVVAIVLPITHFLLLLLHG